MVKFFNRYYIVYSLLIFLFIIIFSFGQSVQFFLWQDDNALIFKLQHLEEQAGVFGPGPLGLGAYRYIAVPYIPLYQLFGMNITLFYIWAILFYFLATTAIFFLVRQLTKNNLVSLLSGAIFAAGFIGSDGILRLFNSIQTSYSIILVCLFFLFLHRFIQLKHRKYYFLALLFFFLALETAFIRTQYLIFPVIVFGLLFLKKKNIFLLFPFLAIYYFIFSQNPDPRSYLLGEFISGILNGQFQYLHGFFGSIGNVIITQPINEALFSLAGKISLDYGNRLLVLELFFLISSVIFVNFLFRRSTPFRLMFSLILVAWLVVHIIFFHDQELILSHSIQLDIPMIFANLIGGLFLIMVSAFWFLARTGKMRLFLIFILSWMLFNILAYSIYLPFSPLDSIHRYLTHSLVAYAIFIPILIYYLWDRRMSIIVAGFIIFSNIWFSINYQHNFIVEKSIPTQNFYATLKQYVPEIRKGSVLYFDVAENEVAQQRFRDFFSVASMPDTTAIAIRYGIDRYDFKQTADFSEFLSFLDDKLLDTAFSFFYGADGLKDTTSITRANLKHGGVANREILTTTPVLLEFSARVIQDIPINPSCTTSLTSNQNKLLFDYILSRDEFLNNASVKTFSQEKYQQAKFLIDDNSGSLWRGGRGWWHEHGKEGIVLDMGKVKNIGQLVWVNGYANSTLTDYQIEISVDGKSWQEVKNIVQASKKDNGLLVTENFPPRPTRFIKMTINNTFDNDAPALGEIEAVESRFGEIDKNKIKTFEAEISCVRDENELRILSDFIKKRGVKINIAWKTEKRLDNVSSFLAKADGLYHKYTVLLPAGGIKMTDLKVEATDISANISLTGIKIIYLSLDDFKKTGL